MLNQIIDLSCELIKMPSVSSDQAASMKVIDYVENFFKGFDNVYIERFEVKGFHSIVIKNFDDKKADIMLSGHIDVVPISQDGQFSPYIEDGKLYGRGAADMKSVDAVMMLVMKRILEEKITHTKVALMLTSDEELSGELGTLALAGMGYLGNFVIIPDGGTFDKIVIKQKGILRTSIEIEGETCHASKPWLGKNPIEKIMDLFYELKSTIEEPVQYMGEEFWGSTVTITGFESGEAINKIPGSAKINFDIRFTEKFTLNTLKGTIIKIANKYNGKVNFIYGGEILNTFPDSQNIALYKDAVKSVTNIYPEIGFEHSGSDGRFFSMYGCEVILHRPTCANLHAKDEWISLKDLEDFYNILYAFIKKS